MVGRRVRIGDEDRGPPGGGELEDGAAGAREDEVGGGERVGEVGHVLEQRVASGCRCSSERRLQLGIVAAAGDVKDPWLADWSAGRPAAEGVEAPPG